MRQRRLQHRFHRCVAVEPLEEPPHFFVEPPGGGCFEVHTFATHWTGHYLHRCRTVVTPGANRDSMHPAPPGREQRRVPAEKAFRSQRLVVLLRRVQHHLHGSVDMTVRRLQPADVDSESTRDRGAHQLGVQLFAFDFDNCRTSCGEYRGPITAAAW